MENYNVGVLFENYKANTQFLSAGTHKVTLHKVSVADGGFEVVFEDPESESKHKVKGFAPNGKYTFEEESVADAIAREERTNLIFLAYLASLVGADVSSIGGKTYEDALERTAAVLKKKVGEPLWILLTQDGQYTRLNTRNPAMCMQKFEEGVECTLKIAEKKTGKRKNTTAEAKSDDLPF